MRRPFVSIIILNYNGKRFLKPCIDAIDNQEYKNFEIVLVDNASRDGSVDFLRKTYGKKKNLRIIESKENLGFTGGNNLGVKKAKGDYIVVLNNDTRVYKDWLTTLVKTMQLGTWKGKRIMIVGSLGVNPAKGDAIPNYKKRKVTMSMSLCGELVSVPQEPFERTQSVKTAFYVGGLSMIFRKKDFPRPFDPGYFAYAEDIYLCWWARLRGGAVVIDTASKLFHYGGGTKYSDKAINRIAVFNGTKNQLMNFLLFYEWKNIVRIFPLFALTQLSHVIHNPKKFIVKCKAFVWIIINWPLLMRKRRTIQRQRKIPDKELIGILSCYFFDPSHTENTTHARVARFMNKLFFAYCWLVRLKTREFS